MKNEKDLLNYSSNDISEWFNEYHDRVSNTELEGELDGSKIIEPFVEMERSCSSIDHTIADIDATLKKTVKNIDRVASYTTSCQFYATAALISINNISVINQKRESSDGYLSHIVGIAHTISNWLFALIGL